MQMADGVAVGTDCEALTPESERFVEFIQGRDVTVVSDYQLFDIQARSDEAILNAPDVSSVLGMPLRRIAVIYQQDVLSHNTIEIRCRRRLVRPSGCGGSVLP